MLVKEERNKALDWIPYLGSWLSEELGLIVKEFTIDFGENGEVVLTTKQDFEDQDEKAEVVGQVAKQIVNGNCEGDTIEHEDYTFNFKRNIKLWTSGTSKK